MIEISNLTISLFNKSILKNISYKFESRSGITAIIGKNGAGKSTFAKAICQLIKSDGTIKVDGRDIEEISDISRACLITYCEELSSQINLEVREVLEFSRVGFSKDEVLLESIISEFELLGLLSQTVSSLSGGERQRLSLACAFYQDPRIIFLDEPTNYLDPKHVDNLILYLQKLNDKKVFIISHDINFLLKIGHDFFALENGAFDFYCNKKELIENELLNKVFDKKFTYIKNDSKVYIV